MDDGLAITKRDVSRFPLLLSVCACWASILLYLLTGKEVMPAEIVSVTSFFLAQALIPRCKMSLRPLVTPLNILQFAFALQLVVMPVTVQVWGFAQHEFLPYPPSILADNVAVLLMTLAYWSFCVGVHFCNATFSESKGAWDNARWLVPSGYIWICAILGILGLAAHYKSLATFEQLLTNPAGYMEATERNGASATALDVIGDFFSSSLGFAVVMIWCKKVDRQVKAQQLGGVNSAALLLVAAAAFVVTGYNRANFVFPLVAVSAVIGVRTPRLATRYLVGVGILIVLLVGASAVYRFSAHPEYEEIGPSIDLAASIDGMELFQLYGQAPQYLAIILDESHYGLRPHFGRLSGSSLLSQIPAVGKYFRPGNGRTYYDNLTGHFDENASFVGEVFLDFNWAGVVVAFVLIGCAVGVLQRKMMRAGSSFQVYVLQTISIYLVASVLISVDVLGQFFIYNMFPIYMYLVCRPMFRPVEEANLGRGASLDATQGPPLL